MSVLIVVCGSASNSSQLHLPSREPFNCRAKVQSASLICGVGPAERTGKSVVTYCPGGSRFFGVCSWCLDLKPREIVVPSMVSCLLLVDLQFFAHLCCGSRADYRLSIPPRVRSALDGA